DLCNIANRYPPAGSILKLRGLLPPKGNASISEGAPLDWSILMAAIELWPRLETYTNLPDGCTSTSAQVIRSRLLPGTGRPVGPSSKAPRRASKRSMVQPGPLSFEMYAHFPFG